MPKLNVLNIQGQNVGEIELSDAVFGVEVNEHVLYEVVKNQLANKRQGTQSAKTRAEVRGGGRKPWRQKGTGRARQGSIRAVQRGRYGFSVLVPSALVRRAALVGAGRVRRCSRTVRNRRLGNEYPQVYGCITTA